MYIGILPDCFEVLVFSSCITLVGEDISSMTQGSCPCPAIAGSYKAQQQEISLLVDSGKESFFIHLS